MRSFAVSLLFFTALLQGGVRLSAQSDARKTVSVVCQCDQDGRFFAELLAKKLPTASFQLVVAGKSNPEATIRIHVTSRQLGRSGDDAPGQAQSSEAVPKAVMTGAMSGQREPIHSTISIECNFPGGRMVEEIKRCDRVSLASLVDEVAADMAAALTMEPVEVDDAA